MTPRRPRHQFGLGSLMGLLTVVAIVASVVRFFPTAALGVAILFAPVELLVIGWFVGTVLDSAQRNR